jgi:hypothetical protein
MATTDQKCDMQKIIECTDLDEGMKQIRALNLPKGYTIRITIETDVSHSIKKTRDPLQSILNIKPRRGKTDSTELIRRERNRLDRRNETNQAQ